LNSGKKSIVLDLKSKAGLKAALDIARESHVVVENWRPGVADRLGVGYEAVREGNEKIIYCSLSGFGQHGPGAQRPAYAPIVHAASGYDLAQMEYQAGDRPAKTGTFIGDVIGGLSAFAAIQAALYRRTQTGQGQYIDVSLLECMFNILIHECQEAQNSLGGPGRLYRPLKTTDGFVVVAPTSQNNFEQLAAVLNHPEWVHDAKFEESKSREANWSELMDLIEDWTEVRSGEQCENTLLDAGVPCTRYKTIAQAMEDSQAKSRQSFSQIEDGAGKYWVPRAPFLMPGLCTAVRSHFPELGESTAHVLKDLLGYTQAEIDACSRI